MPTLNWIGKDAVVRHHEDVPYRLLEPVPELSHADPDDPGATGNLIVQGDNLHALKALLPRYAGQVKCIYIDPPYNTGNEGWVYNDNVNSPEIRKWLHETVGKEGEDLSRHDKWLCMMYPRLVLLRQFLRDDGAIFVSTDDNEVGHLRLAMDEIFGSQHFIANLIWEKRKNRENRKVLSFRHDHILCYSKAFGTERIIKQLPMDEAALKRYKNPDDDPRGPWKSDPATAQAGHGTKTQFYTLLAPNGKQHKLPSGRCWLYTEETMREAIADRRISFGRSGNNVPRIKTFLEQKERGLTPETIMFAKDVSTNEGAKNDLKKLFGGKMVFETPKPIELVQRLIRMATGPTDLVLDSFSGSGATAHAVLEQNAEDGGNRKFILVEMDQNIAENVTAERVRRVADGYDNAKGKPVAGLGGGFQYCRLSEEPLFDATGAVREDVRFDQLAEFVWFSETGSGFGGHAASPLIGVDTDNRAIYLLYNGILKDRTSGGGNVLTHALLADLPTHDGPRVIYAAACRIGERRLAAANIVFKQTPYAIGA
jgi:site-specific DNA-methyltransferase (adenine-specific)/adenine-specific DNA-methyltransferase